MLGAEPRPSPSPLQSRRIRGRAGIRRGMIHRTPQKNNCPSVHLGAHGWVFNLWWFVENRRNNTCSDIPIRRIRCDTGIPSTACFNAGWKFPCLLRDRSPDADRCSQAARGRGISTRRRGSWARFGNVDGNYNNRYYNWLSMLFAEYYRVTYLTGPSR